MSVDWPDSGFRRLLHGKCDTYRYQVLDGGKIVDYGITTDIAAARAECRQRWPTGRFRQVGEKTTDQEAREWVEVRGETS